MRSSSRQAEVAAQHVAGGIDDVDFLDRRGGKGTLPHQAEIVGAAGIDAHRGEIVDGAQHLLNPGLGQRNGAFGRGFGVLLALLVDQAAEPDIEGEHRRTGEHDASDDRQYIFARDRAQTPAHPGSGWSALS